MNHTYTPYVLLPAGKMSLIFEQILGVGWQICSKIKLILHFSAGNRNEFRFPPSIWLFIICLIIPLYGQNEKTKKKAEKSVVELLRSSETEYLAFEQGKENIIIFRGGVHLKFKDNVLKAETIKFNPNTGEIFGEGNVEWRSSDKKLQGDSFFFDNENQTGILFKGKTDIQPLYYHGDSFQQLKKDHYLVSVASFTTCELKNPHYSFRAKKVWIYPNNKLVALHILYQVADIPVFYWPLIFQTDLGTGILTLYGNNRDQGHYLQNTYYFSLPPPLNEYPFLPGQGKILFDYYQYTGELYGLFLNQRSKHLNYDLDFRLANYRRENTVCDRVFSGDQSLCNESKTNFFLDDGGGGGGVITQKRLWWKIDMTLNAQWVSKKKVHSRVVFEITESRHRNFDPEFGNRIEPQTTLNSIYFGPIFQSIGPQNIDWRAEYNLNTKNTFFNLQFQRIFRWNQITDELESKYEPSYDILPRMDFSTRHQIAKPQKNFFKGLWLIFNAKGNITRTLTEGSYDWTTFGGYSDLKNLHQFSFTKWLSFNPYFLYGLKYTTATPQTPARRLESRRQSYHNLAVKAPVQIGDPSLYFKAEYEYHYLILREFQDPTFRNQGPHLLNFLLKGDFYPYLMISLDTKRDLRRYPYPLDERFLWAPIKLFTEVRYDLLQKESASEIFGKKFTLYASWDNTYRYLVRFDRHGTNDTHLNFGARNIKPVLIKNINQVAFSLGWHHDFVDIRQDDLNFRFKLDLQVLSDLRCILETNSRADQFERYTQDVNFFEDILAGFNPFSGEKQNTVFNLDFLRLTLEHELHRWTLRLYYERYRRTIFFGSALENRASFYQQGIYISLTLSDFKFFETSPAQIFRDNPGDDL